MSANEPRRDARDVHNEVGNVAGNVVQTGVHYGDVHFHRGMPPLDQAARHLAEMVARQWRDEAAVRGLDDPRPLRVRWASATPESGDHPENMDAQISGSSDDLTAFVAAFRALSLRRLVVLGAPASGKTSLTVLLLLKLLDPRLDDEPVPVLFSLSSWDPGNEHPRTWLARRIAEDYPALRNTRRYGRSAAAQLVSTGRILPVLDGLDEMPQRQRVAAMRALNAGLGGDPIVLSCRTAEYTATVRAGDVLRSAALIQARPVAPGAARDYLNRFGPPDAESRWSPLFDHLGGPVAAALASPLIVWLVRTVYADPRSTPAELTDSARFPTAIAIENHLLDGLVPAVFPELPRPEDTPGRRIRRWDADQAARWLGVLATHLRRLDTYDLAWWQLPRSLPVLAHRGRQSIALGVFVFLVAAVVHWLGLALNPQFKAGQLYPSGLILSVTIAFGVGLAVGVANLLNVFDARPGPDSSLFGHVRSVLPRMLRIGIMVGAAFTLAVAPTITYSFTGDLDVTAVLSSTITYWTMGSVAVGLAGLLVRSSGPVRADFRLRRRTGLLVSLLTKGLLTGVVLGLLIGVLLSAVLLLVGLGLLHRLSVTSTTDVVAWLVAATVSAANQYGLRAGALGLFLGAVIGFITWLRIPYASDRASGPRATCRADRTVVLLLIAIFALAFGGALDRLVGISDNRIIGGIFGAALGLLTGTWPLYFAAKGWLAGRGKLPWRLMTFLEDAHELGILRQVGAVYQFRHSRLQDHLSAPN